MPGMQSNQNPHGRCVSIVSPATIQCGELENTDDRSRERKQRKREKAISAGSTITFGSALLYEPSGNNARYKDHRVRCAVSKSWRQMPGGPFRRAISKLEVGGNPEGK